MYERDELLEIERQSGTYFYGREAGREEGREEGLERGRRLALIELILGLLADRHVAVPPASEAQIHEATLPDLQRWARRASDVSNIAELLAST